MKDKIINIDTINADGCLGVLTVQYTTSELPTVLPSSCPCCGRVLNTNIEPITAINNMDTSNNKSLPIDYDLYGDFEPSDCEHIAIYQCGSCRKLFAIRIENIYKESVFIANKKASFPSDCYHYSFSENINTLFPNFIKIYKQAEVAEQSGLDMICGMAYRRALEFLIDAYLREKNPETTIEQDAKLSIKIDALDNAQIKTLAQKTAWLGNDQTHIIIKNPGYTVNDIKYFIESIAKCIDAEIAVQKAGAIC